MTATFVLVHGAWGGAHGFGKVRRLLRGAGHEVFTPSLTGIGERAHLSSPQVCLTTHIADVANTVLYEDLRDIVLLGFSYGGLVVTGALEHIAGRVSHLVYLDAFVPGDGDSLETITATAGPAAAIGPGAAWLVPPLPRDFDDPAELACPLGDPPFSRIYIKASAETRSEPPSQFWGAADRATTSPAWRYRE